MRQVSYEEFKVYLKENNLLNKAMAAPMADLIVYEIDEKIVAKVELPNQFSRTKKYLLLN